MKKAFTLAEIMIVLSVIGILTAILLPVARNATPNEAVLKFKKANTNLGNVIRELASSGQYYLEGDLGTKPDGTLVDSKTYLCKTIADIMNVKTQNCSETTSITEEAYQITQIGEYAGLSYGTLAGAKSQLDTACKAVAPTVKAEITTADDVVYYQGSPATHFGITVQDHATQRGAAATTDTERLFGGHYVDDDGMDRIYKIFCIDIDGIPSNATKTSCVNECPFGYGIRADGKILLGARADEWLKKSIQEKE